MSDGAKKAPSALVDPAGFELLLEGLASGVVANIAQVRAGKLKPDEAADRDDAAVRSLARMLMDEHDSVRLGLPLLGAPLAEALRRSCPDIWTDFPNSADAANPRAALVHASRHFLHDVYRAIRNAARAPEGLSETALRESLAAVAALWMKSITGASDRN